MRASTGLVKDRPLTAVLVIDTLLSPELLSLRGF